MFIPLFASINEISCGVDIITAPDNDILCDIVKCASPVLY
jgi:hypothetical protein